MQLLFRISRLKRTFVPAGCALASYLVKYGEVFFDFPFQSELNVALAFIFIPSLLNTFKWYKRSQDPTFEGWF